MGRLSDDVHPTLIRFAAISPIITQVKCRLAWQPVGMTRMSARPRRWKDHPAAMRRAAISPIITQVKCRFARQSVGMIEASATRSPSTPRTCS